MTLSRPRSAAELYVLRALLDAGRSGMTGPELLRQTELPSGSLYPLLNRLGALGYTRHRLQDSGPGRYLLTDAGEEYAANALAALQISSGQLLARLVTRLG